PFNYFREFLPALAGSGLDAQVFFEQKANLRLGQIRALRRAGIAIIQPGIEALSTPLLRLMRKGVSAAQNIDLLRSCISCHVDVNCNLLYAFPPDHLDSTKEVLALLPL